MENEHSKYFIVRQSKTLKFMPKMRQLEYVGPAGELSCSPDPYNRNEGLLLRKEGGVVRGMEGDFGPHNHRSCGGREGKMRRAVSYTHLTLPTIYSV